MILRIGEGLAIAAEDILLIRSVPGGGAQRKTCLLLSDGRVLYSPVTAGTLKKRLSAVHWQKEGPHQPHAL